MYPVFQMTSVPLILMPMVYSLSLMTMVYGIWSSGLGTQQQSFYPPPGEAQDLGVPQGSPENH